MDNDEEDDFLERWVQGWPPSQGFPDHTSGKFAVAPAEVSLTCVFLEGNCMPRMSLLPERLACIRSTAT